MNRIDSYDTIRANTKCSDKPELDRITVRIGDQYKLYRYGEYIGIVVARAGNRDLIEREINDPDNDVTSYEYVRHHDDGRKGDQRTNKHLVIDNNDLGPVIGYRQNRDYQRWVFLMEAGYYISLDWNNIKLFTSNGPDLVIITYGMEAQA